MNYQFMSNMVKNKKKFIFRFDVDTVKCMNSGVDNLIALGEKYDVKFVFYVNMGKAISLSLFIKALFNKSNILDTHSLSAFRKLGLKDYIHTAIVNPNVGLSNISNIKRLIDNGHEVGLHGGRNHADWADTILSMSEEEIKEDLTWSLGELQKVIGPNAVGFASPEWQGGQKLRKVLSEMNFLYCADAHGTDLNKIERDYLPIVYTNIISEPGGVGFFESLTSRNLQTDDLKEIITQSVERHDCSVVYDHPYFSGVEGIHWVEETIKHLKSLDVDIVRYSDII